MKCQVLLLFGILIEIGFIIVKSRAEETETIIEGKNEENSRRFLMTNDISPLSLGYLLCKSCGEDNTVFNLIDNKRISSTSRNLKNVTFGQKEVLVQELRNPRGIDFKVLISKRANCLRTTSNVSRIVILIDFRSLTYSLFIQWFTEATWFDGYAWKICLCPTCKSHIGWMFERSDLTHDNPIYPSDKGFYAIIVDSVISESCMALTHKLLNIY